MYGTASITDLLNDQRPVEGNVEEGVWAAFAATLDAHNALLNENLDEFVERTTDALRGTSGYDRMEMEDLDEFGDPGAQKVAVGDNLGFPLRFVGVGLQWTRLFLRKATVAAITAQFNAAREADVRRVMRDLRRAIYSPVNYDFRDRRHPRSPLIPVKALTNADGFNVPVGPNGELYDGDTHTHYLASENLTAAAVDSLVNTVREHFDSGEIRLAIHSAQESAVRGLTGFDRYVDARIVQPLDEQYARGTLDVANTANRAIGIYNGAEVWVKPWAIPGYLLAYRRSGGLGGRKILAYRHAPDNAGNLEILSQHDDFPLRAEKIGREFGIAVQDRIGAAVLMIGGTTYTAPVSY